MGEKVGKTNPFDISPALTSLVEEIAPNDDIRLYIQSLEAHYRQVAVYELLDSGAKIVEPRDRTTCELVDPEARAAVAFFQGGLLGLRAVELSYGTDFVLEMETNKLRIVVPDLLPDDTVDQRHEKLVDAGIGLSNQGDRGYELAPAYHEKMDEWDIAATRDATTSTYFKRGFGFVMDLSSQALILEQRKAFTEMMFGMGLDHDEWAALEAEFE